MMNLHRRAVLWSAAAAVSLALASADAAPNCSLAPGPELARFYRRDLTVRESAQGEASAPLRKLNIDDAWSVKRVEQHRENGRGDGARGETYQLLQVAKGRELNEHDMWLMAAVLREAGDVLEVVGTGASDGQSNDDDQSIGGLALRRVRPGAYLPLGLGGLAAAPLGDGVVLQGGTARGFLFSDRCWFWAGGKIREQAGYCPRGAATDGAGRSARAPRWQHGSTR